MVYWSKIERYVNKWGVFLKKWKELGFKVIRMEQVEVAESIFINLSKSTSDMCEKGLSEW